MEIDYDHNKLKKQLSTATEIKKAFGVNAKKVAIRLEEIISSETLSVLMTIPAANCHALVADKIGQWALNVSRNQRLIFKISQDPVPQNEDGTVNTTIVRKIKLMGIEDYH